MLLADALHREDSNSLELFVSRGKSCQVAMSSDVAHTSKPCDLEKKVGSVEFGHLEPINVSERVIPIVPVFESHVEIRISGYFIMSVDSNSIIDNNALHLIDEFFIVLQSGYIYTELDLTNIYMHFSVDEVS